MRYSIKLLLFILILVFLLGCEPIEKPIEEIENITEENITAPPVGPSAPENITANETEETEAEEEPEEELKTLNFHEEQVIEIDGIEHNISIHNLEADQVIIIIDDLKSGWIAEKDIFTYANGLTIYVKEILYQPYAGGIQAVNYKIYS